MPNSAAGTKKAVFRADGSKNDGFGHLARSAVLARAFRARGYQPVFLTGGADDAVRGFLSSAGFDFIETPHPSGGEGATFHAETMDRIGARLTVLDSYKIDAAYRAGLKERRFFVAAVDDIYTHYSSADAVINHNPSADPSRYGDFSGKLLCGPGYAIIDPAFSSSRPNGSAPPAILVVLGGTDARGGLGRVLRLLDGVEGDFSITAVAGYYGQTDLPAGFRHPCRIIPHTGDMPSLVSQCSAAITAGGVTCMELACAGLPFLILLADGHQHDNARSYAASGAAMYAGALWEKTDSEIQDSFRSFISGSERWPQMSAKGRNLIDGQGAARVALELDTALR